MKINHQTISKTHDLQVYKRKLVFCFIPFLNSSDSSHLFLFLRWEILNPFRLSPPLLCHFVYMAEFCLIGTNSANGLIVFWLMVNCWFGFNLPNYGLKWGSKKTKMLNYNDKLLVWVLVVWDSNRVALRSPIPFFFRDPIGIQTAKLKPTVITISWINKHRDWIRVDKKFWVVATQTFFIFTPKKLGKIPNLTNIFSDGLKPPTIILQCWRWQN